VIQQSLQLLIEEVESVDGAGEYAIFGSTVLRMRGIIDREPDDIDVIVTRRVWGALLARDEWFVETPSAGDPPILTRECGNDLHLFFAWRDDYVAIDPEFVLATADLVDGVVYCSVEEVLRHKRAAYTALEFFPKVAKHAPDIAACEAWLAVQA
jgi:hypothetical protein